MEKIEGLFGLSASKGSFVSETIQWFRKWFQTPEDGDFIPSHAFLVQGTLRDHIMISESTDPAMRVYPLQNYCNNLNKRFELWRYKDADPAKETESLDYMMMTYSGKWYGYLQLFGYIALTIGKFLGKKVDNPVQDKSQIVCSEYDYIHAMNIGYKDGTLENMNPNNVAPDTLRRAWLKNTRMELVAVKEYGTTKIEWMVD
jgi:hypothetical protein